MQQSRRSSLDSAAPGPPPGLPQLMVRLQRLRDDLKTNKFFTQTRTPEQLDQEKTALDTVLLKAASLETAVDACARMERFNTEGQEAIRAKADAARRELLSCVREVGSQVYIAKDVLALMTDFARQRTAPDTARTPPAGPTEPRTRPGPSSEGGAEQAPSQRAAAMSQLFKNLSGSQQTDSSPSGLMPAKLKPLATFKASSTPEQQGGFRRPCQSETGTPKIGGEERVPFKQLRNNAEDQQPKPQGLKPATSFRMTPPDQSGLTRRHSLSEAGTPKTGTSRPGTPKTGGEEAMPSLRPFRADNSTPPIAQLKAVPTATNNFMGQGAEVLQAALSSSVGVQGGSRSVLESKFFKPAADEPAKPQWALRPVGATLKSVPKPAAPADRGTDTVLKTLKPITVGSGPFKAKESPAPVTPTPDEVMSSAAADAATQDIRPCSDQLLAQMPSAQGGNTEADPKPVMSFAISDDGMSEAADDLVCLGMDSPDSQVSKSGMMPLKSASQPAPAASVQPVGKEVPGVAKPTAGLKAPSLKPAAAEEPKWPKLQTLKPVGSSFRSVPAKQASHTDNTVLKPVLKPVGSAGDSSLKGQVALKPIGASKPSGIPSLTSDSAATRLGREPAQPSRLDKGQSPQSEAAEKAGALETDSGSAGPDASSREGAAAGVASAESPAVVLPATPALEVMAASDAPAAAHAAISAAVEAESKGAGKDNNSGSKVAGFRSQWGSGKVASAAGRFGVQPEAGRAPPLSSGNKGIVKASGAAPDNSSGSSQEAAKAVPAPAGNHASQAPVTTAVTEPAIMAPEPSPEPELPEDSESECESTTLPPTSATALIEADTVQQPLVEQSADAMGADAAGEADGSPLRPAGKDVNTFSEADCRAVTLEVPAMLPETAVGISATAPTLPSLEVEASDGVSLAGEPAVEASSRGLSASEQSNEPVQELVPVQDVECVQTLYQQEDIAATLQVSTQVPPSISVDAPSISAAVASPGQLLAADDEPLQASPRSTAGDSADDEAEAGHDGAVPGLVSDLAVSLDWSLGTSMVLSLAAASAAEQAAQTGQVHDAGHDSIVALAAQEAAAVPHPSGDMGISDTDAVQQAPAFALGFTAQDQGAEQQPTAITEPAMPLPRLAQETEHLAADPLPRTHYNAGNMELEGEEAAQQERIPTAPLIPSASSASAGRLSEPQAVLQQATSVDDTALPSAMADSCAVRVMAISADDVCTVATVPGPAPAPMVTDVSEPADAQLQPTRVEVVSEGMAGPAPTQLWPGKTDARGDDAQGFITLAQRTGRAAMTASMQTSASQGSARILPMETENEWLHTSDNQPPPMARQSLQQWQQRPVLPAVAAMTTTLSPAAAALVRRPAWLQAEAQPATVGNRRRATEQYLGVQSPGQQQLLRSMGSPNVLGQEAAPSGAWAAGVARTLNYRDAPTELLGSALPATLNPLLQSVHLVQPAPELPAAVAAALPAMQGLGLAGSLAGGLTPGGCSNIRVEVDDEYESYNCHDRAEPIQPRRGLFGRAFAAVGTVVSVAAVTAAAALAGAALNAGLDELDGKQNKDQSSRPARKAGRPAPQRKRGANPDILLGRG